MREQSTTKGFAILSLAGIFGKILSLLYVPLLIGIIGQEGFGIYSKTYDVFTFIYALTNIGMQTAIAKYVSELTAMENHRDALRTFKIARTFLLLIGTFFTVALMLSANFIASKKSPSIAYGLIFVAPTIAITSVLVCYRAYFQGRNNVKSVAISTVVEQIANVVISLIFAYILVKKSVPLGSAGGTVGTSIGAVIAVVYLIYIYRKMDINREVKKQQMQGIKVISTKKIIRTIIKYGLPITISAGLQNFGAVVDMMNVDSRLLYAGFSAEGQRNILYGLLNEYKTLIYVPMVIITALGTVILPAISKALVLKDRKEIKSKIKFALRMTYFIAIPSAFGLAVLSNEVYASLYAKTNGHELMVYGSIVLVFMAVVQIQNVILQSINQFYFVIVSMVIGIALKIGANYYFIGKPSINIQGAVIGGFLCFFIPMILNHRRINKKLKINLSLVGMAGKPFFASVYMVIMIMIARLLTQTAGLAIGTNRIVSIMITLLLVAIGGFFYLQGIIYLGGIRKKEIETISPKMVRVMPKILKKHLR